MRLRPHLCDIFLLALLTRLLAAVGVRGLLWRLAVAIGSAALAITAVGPVWGAAFGSMAVLAAIAAWAAD